VGNHQVRRKSGKESISSRKKLAAAVAQAAGLDAIRAYDLSKKF